MRTRKKKIIQPKRKKGDGMEETQNMERKEGRYGEGSEGREKRRQGEERL